MFSVVHNSNPHDPPSSKSNPYLVAHSALCENSPIIIINRVDLHRCPYLYNPSLVARTSYS